MEIWKKIDEFENYEVSNLGRVRRIECCITYSNEVVARYKEKYLKFDYTTLYKRVTLSYKNKTKRFVVHRLVALAFIPNPKNKSCVNHIDGDKINNKVENLEWCTYSENERHSYNVLGKINSRRKLNEDQVKDILNNCIKGLNKTNKGNVEYFMKKYNVSQSTILNIINKKYYV